MILKEYTPTRPSKLRSLLLVGLMISLYLIDNPTISSLMGKSIFIYVVKPTLWIGLALLAWYFPKVKPKGKLKLKSFINWWAFNLGVIYVVISVVAGFIDGLGKSPYNHTPIGMLTNIIFVGYVLVGREFVRSYLTNNFTKEENYFVFILISLLMTIVTISFKRFTDLKEFSEIVKFIAQYFAPEFTINLLATYLAYLGGPLPSIIYIGTLKAFHWLSPILPDLKWITAALVGILVPLFSLLMLQNMYSKEAKLLKKVDKDEESPLSWMVTSLFSIALIWFAVGVFPIYPSVIATGSMEPMIKPGDVILVKKVTNESINDLKTDDVIQFRRDNILISHRIMEIVEDDNGVSYKTKGDNNTGPDTELVKQDQVKGRIIQVVPKVGWPTLLLKQKDDVPLEQIEF